MEEKEIHRHKKDKNQRMTTYMQALVLLTE